MRLPLVNISSIIRDELVPRPSLRTTEKWLFIMSNVKTMQNVKIDALQRPWLSLPNNADKLLLHSCCAPCSGEVMEAITASGIDYTIFFYNPNIHPQREYLIRKEENIRFAEQHKTVARRV